jgi:chloride channel 7
VQPGLHALVGATAMLGGVFRSSISLVVIMVEGTGGIDFILPVILAIVISNWVAHHIHHAGAYEADLERLGMVFLY